MIFSPAQYKALISSHVPFTRLMEGLFFSHVAVYRLQPGQHYRFPEQLPISRRKSPPPLRFRGCFRYGMAGKGGGARTVSDNVELLRLTLWKATAP